MWYIILILVLITLAYIAYRLFDGDYLSPSFMVSVIFLASAIVAALSRLFNMWNYVDLQMEAASITIIGFASFILGEYIARKILNKIYDNKTDKTENNKEKTKIISISKIKLAIVYIFIIITLITIYVQMAQITGIWNNIPQMINEYRNGTPLFEGTSQSTSISTLAMQMYRASELFAYVFIFIIVNNLVLKDKLKNNIKYAILILLSIFITFLVAGRSSFVKMIVAGLFMFVVLYRKNNKDLNKKLLLKIILIVGLIAIAIFYLIMPLIGRKQNSNFINYVTFYIGSPIPSLNEIIQRNEVERPEHFGQNTFKGIQRILDKFGIIDYYTPYQREWIGFDTLSSNTFTGIKTYYSDFGVLGIIACQIISAVTFTIIYITIQKKNSIFSLIFYSFFLMTIIDQYRSEKFFTSFITIDTVIYSIYLFIITKFLFENLESIKYLIGRRIKKQDGRRVLKKD